MSGILEYFCCLFVVYIYVRRVMSSYLLFCCTRYLLRCLVYHMLSKARRNSRSLLSCSDGVYLLYLLRCLVYHMLFKTRRNSGSLHRVIGEVLVLGLLLVVYEIPYSSCIFNTAVVSEPGTMVCAYHTAVYLVHRSCVSYLRMVLPMSWILDLSIMLSI